MDNGGVVIESGKSGTADTDTAAEKVGAEKLRTVPVAGGQVEEG